MSNYIIIPARLQSTRLPRKLLLKAAGKPLIQHTWENCLKVPNIKKVLIATDSDEIRKACTDFGAKVYFAEDPCTSGTERVVKTALNIPNCKIVVNVQAEWPQVNPESISDLIHDISKQSSACMGSLFYRGPATKDVDLVKVVSVRDRLPLWDPSPFNRAIYFSRANIPYGAKQLSYHIGVYVLNLQMIQCFQSLPSCPELESENLEQLKVLANGYPIIMRETIETIGVDNTQSFKKFKRSQK